MKTFFYVIMLAVLAVMGSCKLSDTTVTVSNPLDVDRVVETVKVELSDLNTAAEKFIVIDKQSGNEVPSQLVDKDGDQKADFVLFQVQLTAGESKTYMVKEGESAIEPSEVKTYARFVPERTDDFTWENDRVAFRTYGPAAQRMAEEGDPNGTLSSGIDCWLKKVNYSIINKWYKGNTESPGYYHSDHGEGVDNYHVGPSRGCGGTGVMVDGKLMTSQNYVSHKTIANGPVSTCFVLDYDPYKAGDKTVKVRKEISIDLGTNLTKYVIYVDGSESLTAGITLHDGKGTVSTNEAAGWANYHAPHFGEELSTAIVAHSKYFAGTSMIESDVKDESHSLVHLKVIDGKVEYYSGFYWSPSKQFAGNSEWEEYLNLVSKCLENPLRIDIK